MSNLTHIDEKSIEAYLAGGLAFEESEKVVTHIADCDHCTAVAENLWRSESYPTLNNTIPVLVNKEKQMHQRIIHNRLRRSQLGAQMLWLGTAGFLGLLLTLFKPIIELFDFLEVKDD